MCTNERQAKNPKFSVIIKLLAFFGVFNKDICCLPVTSYLDQ